jgi:hypothetical protein
MAFGEPFGCLRDGKSFSRVGMNMYAESRTKLQAKRPLGWDSLPKQSKQGHSNSQPAESSKLARGSRKNS